MEHVVVGVGEAVGGDEIDEFFESSEGGFEGSDGCSFVLGGPILEFGFDSVIVKLEQYEKLEPSKA